MNSPTTKAGDDQDPRAILEAFIQVHHAELHASICVFVHSAGLAYSSRVADVAHDLLNDVVVEALTHANRYDPLRPTRSWLLGIAANLIKRELKSRAQRAHREPLIGDLASVDASRPDGETDVSLDGLLDHLSTLVDADPEHDLIAAEGLAALLAHVSDSDQEVLRLYVLQGMSGAQVAQAFGISRNAAYLRIHRALKRLGATLRRKEAKQRGEK